MVAGRGDTLSCLTLCQLPEPTPIGVLCFLQVQAALQASLREQRLQLAAAVPLVPPQQQQQTAEGKEQQCAASDCVDLTLASQEELSASPSPALKRQRMNKDGHAPGFS